MCEYTQVEFRCGHVRYTVRAWCTNYERTHKRCPPSVVAVQYRCVLTSPMASNREERTADEFHRLQECCGSFLTYTPLVEGSQTNRQ